MSKEDLRDLLYQKASKEQETYYDELRKMTPEQIIEKAYEIVMREDIMIVFEDDSLSDKQVEALAKLEYPLSACYDEWQDTDVTYMDRIRDVIDDFANEIIKQNEAKKHNPKKYEPER